MTSLPVIPEEPQLLRLYRRALGIWCSHVADEAAFGSCAAYANAALRNVPEANCLLGSATAADLSAIMAYFAQAGAKPLAWHLPDGSPELAPMRAGEIELWQLHHVDAALPQTHDDLTIIPARASFPHVREIAKRIRPSIPADQAGEAAMCHLDDSRVDAVIALRHGQAVAYASVISTGEVGFISDLFVEPELRDLGYELPMAGHVLDICARSLFRTVVWPLSAEQVAEKSLAKRIGFSPAQPVQQRRV